MAKKKKKSGLKTGSGSEETFFQKHTDRYRWSTGKWKLLNIINHQGNTKHTHNELSLHTCQNSYDQKDKEIKCWWGYGEKGTFLHYWWEYKLLQTLWKTMWRFLKKLQTVLPFDPAMPLLGIYWKKTKTLTQKDTWTAKFNAALFTVAKIWKQPKCPFMDEWKKKMWRAYTYTERERERKDYYSVIKKETLPFATTWMDLDRFMLSEIRQKQILYVLTDMWTLKKNF